MSMSYWSGNSCGKWDRSFSWNLKRTLVNVINILLEIMQCGISHNFQSSLFPIKLHFYLLLHRLQSEEIRPMHAPFISVARGRRRLRQRATRTQALRSPPNQNNTSNFLRTAPHAHRRCIVGNLEGRVQPVLSWNETCAETHAWRGWTLTSILGGSMGADSVEPFPSAAPCLPSFLPRQPEQ
mmetsp:Transcript_23680/g.56055  ORF Transcript_23680/g.56055 Transcript_23680/m.56055 type:complete len:182 (+) Transcript_23680:806-1351(+)